ncbi:hypothetical protein GGER_06970 [Serratia rubidaea]
MGIAAGLFIGKPLGIFIFSWLAVKSGIARLPEDIGFKQVFAVSVLCGIGFTMSIFIASLAFSGADEAFSTYSRLGILLGSTAAALVGYALLRLSLAHRGK